MFVTHVVSRTSGLDEGESIHEAPRYRFENAEDGMGHGPLSCCYEPVVARELAGDETAKQVIVE
jgi:hypothetical protein